MTHQSLAGAVICHSLEMHGVRQGESLDAGPAAPARRKTAWLLAHPFTSSFRQTGNYLQRLPSDLYERINGGRMKSPNELPDRDGNKQHRPKPADLANLNVTRPAPVDQPEPAPVEKEREGLENRNVTRPAPPDSGNTA